MAKSRAADDLKQILARLKKSLNESASPKIFRGLGELAVKIVVTRTRLGYGVDRFLAPRESLKKVSVAYAKQRGTYKKSKAGKESGLKSRLTLTGQMLNSVKILSQGHRSVIIGPSGNRNDTSATNAEIAYYNELNHRTFLNISDNEFKQIFRQYRREVGDLLKKRRLLT